MAENNSGIKEKERFDCVLVSPEKTFFMGTETAVQIPTDKGDAVILAGYAPMVYGLCCGIVRLFSGKDNKDKDFFVAGGFAETSNTKLTILANNIETISSINTVDLENKIRDIEQGIELADDEKEKESLKDEMKLAIAKKEAVEKSNQPFHL